MEQRLFMGSLAEELGVQQLKNNYLEGSNSWFGDLREGDLLIPSENSTVRKLLQVKKIETKGDKAQKYYFNVIKEYIPAKKSTLVFGSKYFELNIVTFTNAYKPAYSSGKKSHFYNLTIKDKYKTNDIKSFKFNEENARNIYVSENVDIIKNKKEGDIFFIVSGKQEGYQIIEILEYEEDGKYNKVNIKDMSDKINIEDYGFTEALAKAKKYKYKNKTNLLSNIINEIENEKFYKHPLDSNLGIFYNILIVREQYRKGTEPINEIEEETNEPEQEDNNIEEAEQKEYCFISREEIEKIKRLIEFNKNIILEGVPGVGKTYIAKMIAKEIVEGKEDNIEIIQFHQNYSYEDFIEGLRPSDDGSGRFEAHPGILKKVCNKIKDENKWNEKFVIIIDEINRGNISKIFGEAFMLIEKDKREDMEVRLPYSKEKFSIPENIYFIATMNTMDKSISLFDFALNRRFKKYEIRPCFEDEQEEVKKEIERYLKDVNSENLKILWNKLKEINKNNSEFDDIVIGHSYLCGLNKYLNENIEEIIDFTLNYQLLPQLKEYFIGNTEKIKKIEKYLNNTNREISINEVEEDEINA